MSFFGFDTNLPRDRPSQQASRGMFDQHDPFGGLSRGNDGGEEEILDFEQTYDGLGQQLTESGDTFNDDTFGSEEPVTRQSVGKDFDFAGQTARMRGEPAGQGAGQPVQYSHAAGAAAAKPKRTGYEAYKEPEYIPKLEADASIWGKPVSKKPAGEQQQHARQESTAAGRKMMSLEEVEAMMRAQSRPTPPAQPDFDKQSQGLRDMLGVGLGAPSSTQQPPLDQPKPPVQILQRPQQPVQEPQIQHPAPEHGLRAPQILQRQHSSPHPPRPQSQDLHAAQPPYPTQSQHPVQMPGGPPMPQPQHARGPSYPQPHGPGHARGPSYNGPPITQAQQMMSMTPTDRETYMAEEAKRAKRNHKIHLLSRNNGLMTPQDKNFITRIQLQQLLTAIGGLDNENAAAGGGEEQLAEDFYYQVYAQIRRPPQSGGLSQFAQTYLFQTSGSRYGYGRSRHHPRGGDNHVQRMEQQVARAVEAAKARPKNKSLVVEGSLGKIAFSNSKTPRPLLNIKRPDSENRMRGQARHATIADRKAALRDIEKMYEVLMRLEDHERKLPPPPNEDSPPDVIEGHMMWRSEMQSLNQQLWESLKVMEAISQSPLTPHPFIQILAHSKGKKAIPRVFRHLDEQQRLTMLTLIVIHLDVLDVIRDAYVAPESNTPVPSRVKAEIDLFDQAVMPPLFSYVNEAPLNIIIGLLGLVMDRCHIATILRTKIGLSILTMLISRAELVTQSAQPTAEDKSQWSELYTRLFDACEPVLPYIFPPTSTTTTGSEAGSASDDVYVWQFLAAMGVGASPDQQQRLVLGVKDKVMETVGLGKEMAESGDEGVRRKGEGKLAEVNLFMRAIGLDVELLG